MIEGMKMMTRWHTVSSNALPMRDGCEVEVNEFDFRDDSGVCYDKDGVVIRHWRRVHGKDGASAYRLDWNGLSFVWTGDGRPDPQTAKLCHTRHYATGDMFKQVKPRIAMAAHLGYDEQMVPEMVADIRTHHDGLFQFGAPDGVVVNVTKKAIWTRKAALPDSTNFARPSAKQAIELFDLSITKTTADFPNPRTSVAEQEEPFPRNSEHDAKLWYPPDVYRKPDPVWPKDFKIDVGKMTREKIFTKIKAIFDE